MTKTKTSVRMREVPDGLSAELEALMGSSVAVRGYREPAHKLSSGMVMPAVDWPRFRGVITGFTRRPRHQHWWVYVLARVEHCVRPHRIPSVARVQGLKLCSEPRSIKTKRTKKRSTRGAKR